ncbi:MAG: Lrp/AsnC family transcriptional regulator [Deltaproteobacteria bacterium]|nr:Lrp/AsnC family transcriptional regulator [Deltaproteobacteria bacterium]
MITEIDKKVISLIQKDLPVDRRPFALIADKIGITEEKFIERVNNLKKQGIIRRFGATLRHQEAGFSSNAMIAWLVPEERIDEAGRILSGFREVTHCYHRKPNGNWRYNLYSMIHGKNREQCYDIAARMAQSSGIDKYELLFSEKEFRKTSMEYF